MAKARNPHEKPLATKAARDSSEAAAAEGLQAYDRAARRMKVPDFPFTYEPGKPYKVLK